MINQQDDKSKPSTVNLENIPSSELSQQQRRSAEDILEEASKLICTFDEDKKNRLRYLEKEFSTEFPLRIDEFEALKEKRKERMFLLKSAYELGFGKKISITKDDIKLRAHKLGIHGFDNKLKLEFERGQKNAERIDIERKRAATGKPLSHVTPRPHKAVPTVMPQGHPQTRQAPPLPDGLHPNDIRALTAASDWTLLLDETGSDFSGRDPGAAPGKFVGLLVNAQSPGLPPLPKGWHAVDCNDPDQIDQVFQAVLDAPCGVIGLHLSALPATPGERWLDGMLAIIDWILRILPLNGPTRIHVAIEGRPPFPPEIHARVVARDSLAKLARVWPERASLIDLRVQTISKDGHPLNGYVDALAFTWGSSTRSSKERLKLSGMLDTCLIRSNAKTMMAFWDAWDRPGGLSAADWAELVSSPEARRPESIASTLLKTLAQACELSSERLNPYLEEYRRHLVSKAINLPRLAAQVDWLQPILNKSKLLTPVMRLIWLTATLAHSNHYGDLEKEWNRELHQLTERLREEDSRLVCHAILHLAVNASNRFDFAAADQVLAPWRDSDPAAPGLRLWGQVLSCSGQMAAFWERHAEAAAYFEKAVGAFRRLSDPEDVKRECAQTFSYRAISAMDDPAKEDAVVYACLVDYLKEMGLPHEPAQAAIALAGNTDSALKYAHHTLLRWLVYRGDNGTWEAYSAQNASWGASEGHPWPLIQLYRAILLRQDDQSRALELALDAAVLGFSAGQGPTVQLIGACCRAVASHWGAIWADAGATLEALRTALPLASSRIDALENWLVTPEGGPREILKTVLPFNFR